VTVNPETGIDADVDRFVVFPAGSDVSSHNNATWPRFDGGPISGGFVNGEKWYKKVESTPPTSDHRYTRTTTWGRVEADPAAASDYPAGTWEATHAVVRRPAEELKLQVDAEFQRQVRMTFPDSENPATIIEAAGVIARKQAGSPITTEQQTLLDSFIGMEDVIQTMRARQLALYAAIDADEDYDQTTGWTQE